MTDFLQSTETFLFVAVTHLKFQCVYRNTSMGMKRFFTKIRILECDSRNIAPFSNLLSSPQYTATFCHVHSESFTNCQAYGVLRQEPLNFLERLEMELQELVPSVKKRGSGTEI